MPLFAVLRHMVHTSVVRSNRRHTLRHIVAWLIIVCVFAFRAGVLLAAPANPPSRVRSTDATILELLREGRERSSTFSMLIDAVDRSRGIVYVEFGDCVFGRLHGCMLPFIAPTGGDRYLRIIVTPDKNRRNRDQLLALIGHELRHAIEVIEHEEVIDVATMELLYRRIGIPITGRVGGYETSAARVAENAVLSELLGKSRNAREVVRLWRMNDPNRGLRRSPFGF